MSLYDEPNVFEDAQPWYRSPLPWVAIGLLAAVLGGFSIHALNESSRERRTNEFLSAYAEAATPDARLKLAQAHLDLPAVEGELVILGAAFVETKNLESARTAYGLAADHFPGNPLSDGARLALAEVLEAQGKVDDALALLQKPGRTFPDGYRPYALLVLGRLQQGKKNFTGARQSWEDLVAKYPQSAFLPEARQQLASLPAS